MRKYIIVLITISIVGFISCTNSRSQIQKQEGFSFAFLTDIHINSGNNKCKEGLQQAIEKAKLLGVDFIITGGDNVDADGVGDNLERATKLYEEFSKIIDASDVDIRVTIGNHDRFWHEADSRTEHGTGLFKQFFGDTFYEWDHKGVHFIHLNTTEVCERRLCVSDDQKNWLNGVLSKIDEKKPIVLIAHVPFLSFYYPALEGHYTDKDIFSNFKEIWNMFSGHNLQLVLQGHMHLYEELRVLDTQFLTGGAVSASWWGGSFHGTEEGFVLIDWDGKDFSWKYVDYGWQAHVTK
jgi:hypothetical protein